MHLGDEEFPRRLKARIVVWLEGDDHMVARGTRDATAIVVERSTVR
jgi:hypothetical protein